MTYIAVAKTVRTFSKRETTGEGAHLPPDSVTGVTGVTYDYYYITDRGVQLPRTFLGNSTIMLNY